MGREHFTGVLGTVAPVLVVSGGVRMYTCVEKLKKLRGVKGEWAVRE